MTSLPSGPSVSPLSNKEIETWRQRIRAETFANYAFEMGVALLKNGEPAPAIAQLRKALDFLPNHAGARLSLMNALLALGKSEEAQAVDKAGQQLDAHFRERLNVLQAKARLEAQDPDGAEPLLAQARAALPRPCPDLAEVQSSLALQWLGKGAFTRARQAFEQAFEDDGDVLRLRDAGKLLLEAGAPEEAEPVIADFCRRMPEDGEGLLRSSFIALALGKVKDAADRLPHACRLLKDTPLLPWAEAGLAIALLSIGSFEEAQRLIPALPLPADTVLPMRMAWVLAQVGTGRAEDVLAASPASIGPSRSHQDARLESVIALCRMTVGDLKGAGIIATKAAEVSHGDDFCYLVKAILEASLDRIEQAQESVRIAQEKKPHYVPAHAALLRHTVPAARDGLLALGF